MLVDVKVAVLGDLLWMCCLTVLAPPEPPDWSGEDCSGSQTYPCSVTPTHIITVLLLDCLHFGSTVWPNVQTGWSVPLTHALLKSWI